MIIVSMEIESLSSTDVDMHVHIATCGILLWYTVSALITTSVYFREEDKYFICTFIATEQREKERKGMLCSGRIGNRLQKKRRWMGSVSPENESLILSARKKKRSINTELYTYNIFRFVAVQDK